MCLGWAVELGVPLPGAVGRTGDSIRRSVGHRAGSSPMSPRGSTGRDLMPALGTTWPLHPLLQPPKLPHNPELGGWHGLSNPVGSQGLAPAAGAASLFHEDAPLQPAHLLCHCCSPAARSLLLLGSLPSSRMGAVGLAVCWGAAGDRGLSLLRAVAHWQHTLLHAEATGVSPDTSPGREHTHSPSLRAGGCHSMLPLPPSFPHPWPHTSSTKLCSWHDTACARGSLPRGV